MGQDACGNFVWAMSIFEQLISMRVSCSFGNSSSRSQVKQLVSGAGHCPRRAPAFGQRRCTLLGFWGSSEDEIREEMRWDGML